VLSYLDKKILGSQDRRVTIGDRNAMSNENKERLRKAYRDPFEKVPKKFYEPNANEFQNPWEQQEQIGIAEALDAKESGSKKYADE
jgi:hypothetical protein